MTVWFVNKLSYQSCTLFFMRGSIKLPRIKTVNLAKTADGLAVSKKSQGTSLVRRHLFFLFWNRNIVWSPTGEPFRTLCPAQMDGEAQLIRLLINPACSPDDYVGDVPWAVNPETAGGSSASLIRGQDKTACSLFLSPQFPLHFMGWAVSLGCNGKRDDEDQFLLLSWFIISSGT